MKGYFDRIYNHLSTFFRPFADIAEELSSIMIEVGLVILAPLWIIPYKILKICSIKEDKMDPIKSNPDAESMISVSRAEHNELHGFTRKEKQAIFRLGQMDMQVSVCDMLRQLADGAADPVSAGLILAVDLVESMEVDHADS